MPSSRSPDIQYNGSGYADFTAKAAIVKADKERLKQKRRQVIEKFNKIAAENGLRIDSYIRLTEIGGDEA